MTRNVPVPRGDEALDESRPRFPAPMIWATLLFLFSITALVAAAMTLTVQQQLIVYFGQVMLWLAQMYKIITEFRGRHFELSKSVKDLRELVLSMKDTCRAAHKRELYGAMIKAVGQAHRYALVTYFSQRSPVETRNEEERSYHQMLVERIAARPDMSVLRIIGYSPLDTAAKKKWICEQVELSKRHRNYRLRLMAVNPDSAGSFQNVQVFDEFVFLIDPGRTREDLHARDVHIHSQEIAVIWERYFRKLFDQALELDSPEVLDLIKSYTVEPRNGTDGILN